MLEVIDNGFTGSVGKFMNNLKSSTSDLNSLQYIEGNKLIANGAFTGVFELEENNSLIKVVSFQKGKKSFKRELLNNYNGIGILDTYHKEYEFEYWSESRLKPINLDDYNDFFMEVDNFTADEIIDGKLKEYFSDCSYTDIIEAIEIATKSLKKSSMVYHGDLELDLHGAQFALHPDGNTLICIDL